MKSDRFRLADCLTSNSISRLLVLCVSLFSFCGDVYAAGVLRQVIADGDVLADGTSVVRLNNPGELAFNNKSDAIFVGTFKSGETTIFGLASLNGVIVKAGDTLSGIKINQPRYPLIDDARKIIFRTNSAQGSPILLNGGIFTPTQLLFGTGSVVGGYELYYPPLSAAAKTLTSSGDIYFASDYSDGSGSLPDGLFSPTILIASEGDTIDGKTLTAIRAVSANNHGDLIFSGEYYNDQSQLRSAIFTPNQLLVAPGDIIDGKTLTGSSLGGVLKDDGEVIFCTQFEGADFGIFNLKKLLVAPGDVVDGKTLTLPCGAALNDLGEMAFRSDFVGGAGIFTSKGLVVSVGDQVAGKTISALGDFLLNDLGDLLFFSTFTDGTHALVIGRLDCGPADDTDGNGNPDNDGDSLCDSWEKNGIDIDGDGNNELVLNTDIDRPDIFVELDYMDCTVGLSDCLPGDQHNHRMPADVVQDLIAKFAKHGITLHLEQDERIREVKPVRFTTPRGPGAGDDFDDFKEGSNDPAHPGGPCGVSPYDGHFGTEDDRKDANCALILAAKRLVYRYALLADTIPSSQGDSTLGQSDHSNDIMLGIEYPYWYNRARQVSVVFRIPPKPGKSSAQIEFEDLQERTFLHELGHSLGLEHGGNEKLNCKPNYLSVMNYLFNFNRSGKPIASLNAPSPTRTDAPIDFSDSPRLDALVETDLNESLGINGPLGQRTLFGRNGDRYIAPSNGPIDWNTSTLVTPGTEHDTGVTSTVHFISNIRECAGNSTSLETLTGYDDWNNLDYNFRIKPEFANSEISPSGEVDELTLDDYITGALGGVLGDVDGDGVNDINDNCTYDFNPQQEDTDGDLFGNLCDADLNNDGITNSLDLGIFKAAFFTSNPDADLNSDGIVNSLDLGIFKARFLTESGPSGLIP